MRCQAVGRARGAAVCRASSQKPSVVVTREAGKNGKLIAALARHGISCVELPLIEHAEGPDRAALPGVLAAGQFDWVAVTSPEAASVFLEGWEAAGKPKLRVAVVGGGTGEILEQAGVTPAFTATKATGVVMGAELPKVPNGRNVVLYPASCKASTDLQNGLRESGFDVVRLNTYDTKSIGDVPPALLASALEAPVVTFGSPSAVKAWVGLVGQDAAEKRLSVCIGSTSAKACRAAGLTKVYFPDAPGIEGWVASVLDAMREAGIALPAAV